MPVRILIADDHSVVRKGLRALLDSRRGWKVCAEVANGREAIAKAKTLKPDVAILDIGMPGLGGVEATRQIRKASPNTEVLILSAHGSEKLVREALGAGAHGYLLKEDADHNLFAAVDALRRHTPFFTSKIAEWVARDKRGARAKTSAKLVDAPPAGNNSTARGRQKQQGSRGASPHQREDGGDAPGKYHAQAGSAFGHGPGSLRDSKRNRPHLRISRSPPTVFPLGRSRNLLRAPYPSLYVDES